MAVQLSRQRIIERDVLREVGDARLREAQALLQAKCSAGAVYLGGYAAECYLKLAICVTLDWDALRGMFKTHDLEGLLLYSGLFARLRANPTVQESFAKIVEMWVVEGENSTRYRKPSEFDEANAILFLHYVNDPEKGVVPWLRRMISG